MEFSKKRNKVCCTIIRGTRVQLSDVWVHNNLVNIEYWKTQNSAYFSTETIRDQRQRIDRIHTLVADPLPKYCVKQIYGKHAFVYHVQGRRYWVGRVGICPPSFSKIRGKKSLKLAKFMQLLCTYCRCRQNLRLRPPSF